MSGRLITIGTYTGFTRGKACIGKRAFTSGEAARVQIVKLVRKRMHQPERGTLHAYVCPHCGRFHLGHRR